MTQFTTRLIIVTLESVLAFGFGMGIAHLGLGSVAWIFGGMAAGVVTFRGYQLGWRHPLKPNKILRKIGQGMVGLSIGSAIANSNFLAASAQLPLFIFLTLFMLLCGSGIGYLYARLSQTNLLNAMLATVPGGVVTMSSLAADYGRNVSLVAMVQTLRITSVILVIPLIAGTWGSTTNQTSMTSQGFVIHSNPTEIVALSLLGLTAWFGVKLATQLRIPAASFFGALIIGIVFKAGVSYLLPTLDFTPPQILSVLGQILLGIAVGEAWSNCLEIKGKTLTYAVVSVAMTIASGFLAATFAMTITPWDWLTCMLITAPGGSTEMILVALALDHHPEIVTVAHSVRLVALNLSLPLWIFLFRYWEKQTISSKQHQVN